MKTSPGDVELLGIKHLFPVAESRILKFKERLRVLSPWWEVSRRDQQAVWLVSAQP